MITNSVHSLHLLIIIRLHRFADSNKFFLICSKKDLLRLTFEKLIYFLNIKIVLFYSCNFVFSEIINHVRNIGIELPSQVLESMVYSLTSSGQDEKAKSVIEVSISHGLRFWLLIRVRQKKYLIVTFSFFVFKVFSFSMLQVICPWQIAWRWLIHWQKLNTLMARMF